MNLCELPAGSEFRTPAGVAGLVLMVADRKGWVAVRLSYTDGPRVTKMRDIAQVDSNTVLTERSNEMAKTEKKAAKPAADRKPGLLASAAKLLAQKKGKGMKCKDIVEELAKKGMWESPGGKTPEATLAAAIITEIAKKGKESRFKKVDKGLFASANGRS